MSDGALAEQFDDLEQQQQAASLGMWIFLATELLFFGGPLLAYTVYRAVYPNDFAKAGHELNLLIGTINTVVLLTSSYFMALALQAVKSDRRWKSAAYLAVTAGLGLVFLGLKAYEYADDIRKHLVPGASALTTTALPGVGRIFYFIYYVLTGLHALHLSIGVALIGTLILRIAFGRGFSSRYHAPVEVIGLYWHFVDIVWIFLYPLLYLMDRSR